MRRFSAPILIATCMLIGGCETSNEGAAAQADTLVASSWRLDAEESGMTYITTTNGSLGEINTFRAMDGIVTADGFARLTIETASVDTNNPERDAVMRDVIFQSDQFPRAEARGKIDMKALEMLPVGSSGTVLFDLELEIAGETITRPFYLLVTRMETDRVMVTNKAPLILLATDFGLMKKLKGFSESPRSTNVSPVVPVTMTLVFERR